MGDDRTVLVDLPGGRTLCADDVGDPRGTPVLFVHGTPDSRRARHPDDGLAAGAGVRLVAVDRPGFGRSDLDPSGTVGSFADDVAVLADQLSLDRFAVLAWSAGAIFGVGVAAKLTDRVTRLALVAGLPSGDAYAEPGVLDGSGDARLVLADLAAELPPHEVGALIGPMLAPVPCSFEDALAHVREHADPLRTAELESVPGAWEAMARGVQDSVAQGDAGLVHDVVCQVTPLDVDPALVRCPVRLWYGDGDTTAPPAFGRWWSGRLPGAELVVLPGAGHCFLLPRWTEVLSDTAGRPWPPERRD